MVKRSPSTASGISRTSSTKVSDTPVQPEPAAAQVSPSSTPRCHVCQKDALFSCGGCAKIFYCSSECQQQHWVTHEVECPGEEVSYEEPLIFTAPPPSNLFCAIFGHLVKSPVVAPCGHSFCNSCISRLAVEETGIPAEVVGNGSSSVALGIPVSKGRNVKCPLDGRYFNLDALYPILALDESVKNLEVACRYGCKQLTAADAEVKQDATKLGTWTRDSQGCNVTITLGARVAHEEVCEWRWVSCPYDPECPQVRANQLAAHMDSCAAYPCPCRKFGCEFRGTQPLLRTHTKTCTYVSVQNFLQHTDDEMSSLRAAVDALEMTRDRQAEVIDDLQSEVRVLRGMQTQIDGMDQNVKRLELRVGDIASEARLSKRQSASAARKADAALKRGDALMDVLIAMNRTQTVGGNRAASSSVSAQLLPLRLDKEHHSHSHSQQHLVGSSRQSEASFRSDDEEEAPGGGSVHSGEMPDSDEGSRPLSASGSRNGGNWKQEMANLWGSLGVDPGSNSLAASQTSQTAQTSVKTASPNHSTPPSSAASIQPQLQQPSNPNSHHGVSASASVAASDPMLDLLQRQQWQHMQSTEPISPRRSPRPAYDGPDGGYGGFGGLRSRSATPPAVRPPSPAQWREAEQLLSDMMSSLMRYQSLKDQDDVAKREQAALVENVLSHPGQ
jgi:hypothetical protein